MNGILNVEASRIAQEKFGHRTLTGEEVRWGFEHLQLDPARVEALGAKGLFQSINVTWENHEGDGYVTFQQWDGKKWKVVSDWIAPDRALLRPIIEKSAERVCEGEGPSDPHEREHARRELSAPAAGERRRSPLTYPREVSMAKSSSSPLLKVANLRAVYNGAVVALRARSTSYCVSPSSQVSFTPLTPPSRMLMRFM